jgi:hypothetical protein
MRKKELLVILKKITFYITFEEFGLLITEASRIQVKGNKIMLLPLK